MSHKTCFNCQQQIPGTAQFCPYCGQTFSGRLTGKLPAQSMLDNRYLIIRIVGQGGMGAVYQATDMRIQGRLCAVKEMSIQAILPQERAQAVQNFEQEAQLLAKLQHPCLPQVHDFFQDGGSGRYYLVMDFVEGETLESILSQQGVLSEDVVRTWGSQLCAVLHYLHQQSPPIIFRDLKPGNIMLDTKGQIKLIDFGIARFFKPTQTKDTQVIGTPGFAAPEQYGQGQTDTRSDIYGLGVTLLTLLTGYDPAQNPFALPAASQLNPTISAQMTAVIQQATQIKPEQRWQSTIDMQKALTTGSLTKISEGSTGRDKKLWWLGGIILLLALLGFAGWIFNQNNNHVATAVPVSNEVFETEVTRLIVVTNTALPEATELVAEDVAAEEVAVMGVEPATQTPTPVPSNTPSPTPPSEITGAVAKETSILLNNAIGGGSGAIAYSAQTPRGREIFIYNTLTEEVQQITHDDYNDESPVWSPDGRYIAYTSERNGQYDIFIIDVETGTARNLTNNSNDDAYPSWSSNGSQLLFHSNRYGDFDIFLINADGSNLQQLTDNDIPDLAPEWSPDGSQISFTQAYNNRRQIALMNANGSNIKLITSGEDYSRAHPSWSPNGQQLVFHMVPDLSIGKGIFVIDKDGGNLRQITDGLDFEAKWSPDGEWILFHRNSGDSRAIYRIRPDGTDLTLVRNNPLDVRQPSWQP